MKKSETTIQITITKGILIPAFVMLLVAMLAFVTATYAWISSSVNYNVDDISMSAGISDTGIFVSADCETWKQGVVKADLLAGYEGSRNMIPQSEILPVSCAGIFDGDVLAFYGGRSIAGKILAERAPEPGRQTVNGNYFAYDLFFRVDRRSTVYLGCGSAVTDTAPSATPVSAAVRVAFVNYGNADESAEARELSRPVANNFVRGYKPVAPGSLQDVREIYYRLENGVYERIDNNDLDWRLYYELLEAGNLYIIDDSATVEAPPLRIWEPNAATHTASVTATGPLETRAVTAEGYITDENTAPIADGVLFNDLQGFRKDTTYVATVEPGYNKVRVYIWLEGQDADALDEVGGGSFSAELRFVLA